MNPRKIVVIAASRGGFYALRTLVAGLPATFSAAVCIVLHIGRHKSTLPELMRGWGPLHATHAKDGEALIAARIYIAPPDRHLLVERGHMRLSDSAPENFSRPAADPLMRSASMAYGNRVVGVVLSGDLDDGAAGLAIVHARGGQCLVQRPAECEAPSMPNAALRAVDGAAIIESVETMAAAIVSAVHAAPRKSEDAVKADRLIREEAEVASRGVVSPQDLDRIGQRSALTCPECGGSLWQLEDERPHRYRCHTGHAFSELSLEDGIVRDVERAIWSAVRTVREHRVFAREQHERALRSGDTARAAKEDSRVEQAEALDAILRDALHKMADSERADD